MAGVLAAAHPHRNTCTLIGQEVPLVYPGVSLVSVADVAVAALWLHFAEVIAGAEPLSIGGKLGGRRHSGPAERL